MSPARNDRSAAAIAACAAPWRGIDRTLDGCVAVAGIGEATLRIAVAPEAPLTLAIIEECLTLGRREEGAARTAHEAAVLGDGAAIAASLGAVVAAPRRGSGHLALTLLLRLSVTNDSAGPVASPMLRLAWSAAMPRQPACLRDAEGDPVATRVGDRRFASARFAAAVTGPGVGDRKAGGTPVMADDGGGVPGRPLGPHGWVTPLASPDLSEGVLALAPLAPGGTVTLAWTLHVAAAVDAAGAAAVALTGLTGGARRT